MKFYAFILLLAMFSWSCSSKDEKSSDSTVASVCSETSSDAEVFEIFQLGTTNLPPARIRGSSVAEMVKERDNEYN